MKIDILPTAIFLNKAGIKPDTQRLKALLNRGLNNEMILAILESQTAHDFNEFEKIANDIIATNNAGGYQAVINAN
jgi:hypothetical protein